ncbi:MAG: branched-chain-amino-acid transaminase [Candidatus Bathyarchaeia archaeon]
MNSSTSLEEEFVYIDGQFVPRKDAKISVWDHGLLYGDGVYEAIRIYEGNIFKLKEHVNRLYYSAKAIKIDIPITKEELLEAVVELVKKNKLQNGYLRIVVTRGVGPMGADPRNCKKPTIIIMSETRKALFEGRPIVAIVSSVRRIPSECLDPRIKSLNYLNNVLAKIQAIEAGADEAIMLNLEGYVSEAVTENVFVVKNNIVYTPPLTAGILEGITRNVVIEIIKNLGLQMKEENLTIYDLYTADEVFLTGTAAEITPVVKIDGRLIGNGEPGPIYKKVIEEYRKIVKNPKFGVKA